MITYPVDSILPRLKQAVLQNPSVVLHAPPGAGKTTRVPPALLDIVESGKRIVMLEPRRIAAVAAARWMARSLGEQVGETVGFSIRFESKVSRMTRIEVVTEGILTRRIQSDPALEDVALVIFDEFHERSLHADLALALCLDARKQLRTDLRILVMSATLDHGPVAALLGNAAAVRSSGKAFPVEERFLADLPGPLPLRVAAAVRTALRETHGDILAFLPGAGEIRACAHQLRQSLDLEEERLSLHPLYGDLPFEEQERAILPVRDRRKIVLATNIAETSLTIEGVHVVVDSGFARRLRYDAATGMNRLATVPISRASAEQRKGRAGRLGPGVCYRLYDRHELQGFPPFTRPEILESDLASLVLELAAWGVKEPSALSWLDPPPGPAWNSGLELLRALGALDGAGSITTAGREMARLPLHPRLSRLLLRARELGCVRLGAEIAAILSDRDPFRKAGDQRARKDPDMDERVQALHRWQRDQQAHAGADAGALRAIDRAAKQLLRLMPETRDPERCDQALMPRLLLSAFPDRIGKRREEGEGRYVLAQGRGVRVSPDSHLVNSRYLVAVNVDQGEKAEGVVHIAAPVDEEDIRSECPGNIRVSRTAAWDRKEGRIAAAVEERIGELLLAQKTFTPSDDETIPVLCDAIRSTPGLLVFNDEARQFLARVELIKRAFPEQNLPDLSERALRDKPGEWLAPWLGGIRTAQALRQVDLLTALKARLDRGQQRFLEDAAPRAITVPSGSRVRIDYTAGDQPVLSVKLQELFGLAESPAIANGRVRVLLHLLSPAGRPVQITQDLKAFWNSGYQLVKKDLKGRYPKHPWPEDPWNAAPTRRTKGRGK